MRKHLTKKRVILLAVVALAIGLGTGAFAYFTNSGSGTGSATVGSSSAVGITNDTPTDLLYPGGPDVSVAVHVNNPGSGNQYVDTISGVVEDNGTCLGSWFEVDSITFQQNVDAGDTLDTSTDMRMLDPAGGVNQDACKDLTMTIDWTSN
jgi:hypothetical protein